MSAVTKMEIALVIMKDTTWVPKADTMKVMKTVIVMAMRIIIKNSVLDNYKTEKSII